MEHLTEAEFIKQKNRQARIMWVVGIVLTAIFLLNVFEPRKKSGYELMDIYDACLDLAEKKYPHNEGAQKIAIETCENVKSH